MTPKREREIRTLTTRVDLREISTDEFAVEARKTLSELFDVIDELRMRIDLARDTLTGD